MFIYLMALGVFVGIVGSWFVNRRNRRTQARRSEVPYEGPYKQRLNKSLVSWEYGLTGKPDYLVEHEGIPVPVLVKTGLAPKDNPHDSHVAQILVYCLLVHETTQVAPPFGIIRYADRTFEVDYTESAVQALLELVDEMRAARGKTPARSHDSRRRCVACSHRRHCDQSLARRAPSQSDE